MSQSPTIQSIKTELLAQHRITRYDSRNAGGTESLHSVVSILRHRNGWRIRDRWVWRIDAIGQRKHVKEYWVEPDEIERLRGAK